MLVTLVVPAATIGKPSAVALYLASMLDDGVPFIHNIAPMARRPTRAPRECTRAHAHTHAHTLQATARLIVDQDREISVQARPRPIAFPHALNCSRRKKIASKRNPFPATTHARAMARGSSVPSPSLHAERRTLHHSNKKEFTYLPGRAHPSFLLTANHPHQQLQTDACIQRPSLVGPAFGGGGRRGARWRSRGRALCAPSGSAACARRPAPTLMVR